MKNPNQRWTRKFLGAFLGLSLLMLVDFAPPPVRAQIFNGPISRATGNSGRAAIEFAEATLLNPAAITQARGVGLALHHGTDLAAASPRSELAMVVVDHSRGVAVPASFVALVREEGEGVEVQDYQLALAYAPFGKMSIGLAGHHLVYENQQFGLRESLSNIHLGALYTPYQNLGFALVMYDVLSLASLPTGVPEPPGRVGLGSQYYMSDLIRFRLDLAHNYRGPGCGASDLMFGFESHVLLNLAIRMGFEWKNTSEQRFFTAGLGWKGPRLSFDVAVQKDVNQAGGWAQLIDLHLPL